MKTKIYYCVRKGLPLVPILSQLHPVRKQVTASQFQVWRLGFWRSPFINLTGTNSN